MSRLVGAIRWSSSALNRCGAILAAATVASMTGLILVEIVLRFFSRSTFMADALVAHGVAAATFLAMPWALEHDGMIRVQVLTARLPGGWRWASECFAIVGAGALVAFLVHYQWLQVVKMWTRGTLSQHRLPIPLWIPETLFFTGLALLALQLLVRLLVLLRDGVGEESALSL